MGSNFLALVTIDFFGGFSVDGSDGVTSECFDNLRLVTLPALTIPKHPFFPEVAIPHAVFVLPYETFSIAEFREITSAFRTVAVCPPAPQRVLKERPERDPFTIEAVPFPLTFELIKFLWTRSRPFEPDLIALRTSCERMV